MRLLTLTYLLLCTAALFTACKKDNDDAGKPTIVGFWKGKYGSLTSYPTFAYGQLFRSDGTVRIYDGNDTATAGKGEGTYAVTNSTVTISYSYSPSLKFSTTTIMNPAMTFQEGTYGSGTNPSNGGRYFLVKQ